MKRIGVVLGIVTIAFFVCATLPWAAPLARTEGAVSQPKSDADDAKRSVEAERDAERNFQATLEGIRKDFQLSESLWDVPPIQAARVIPIPIPNNPPGSTNPGRDGAAPSVPRTREWNCSASCNVQQIDRNASCEDRVTGEGSGSSEALACANAKRAAVSSASRGCYARHCQCRCG